MGKKKLSMWISYIYTFLVQFRVTRIINVLFVTQILGMRLTEFAILAVLLYVWFARWEMARVRRGCLAAFLTMLYACSDEFHQLFVAGRSGRISDVLIDSAGAVLGMAAFMLVESIVFALCRRRRARKVARNDGNLK